MEAYMTPENIWFAIGIFFLVLEMVGISGAGLFFGGLGAILVGGLINAGILEADATLSQIIVFAIASAGFAAALWKPVQRLQIGRKGKSYNNIVGETAYVSNAGLSKKSGGEVSWSGTIMRAKLDASVAAESLEAGTAVLITEIEGITLTVKPKD